MGFIILVVSEAESNMLSLRCVVALNMKVCICYVSYEHFKENQAKD